MSDLKSVEKCFSELLQLRTQDLRVDYLKQIGSDCGELRKQLEKLLDAHEHAGSFLQDDSLETTQGIPSGAEAGNEIGPYKLRERLGAGGMGIVWAAEQTVPICRKVALKLIKPGMDSEQVLARFDAEREALSRMDHPHIARVLDAGKTQHGYPYFVMELIRGVPVTEYCDARRLSIRERLSVFSKICGAVQHAHQKGVIHRDIKPSNVLVSEQDGELIPKVIDFGVAKALHQPLTDHSLYTGVFQALGTLQYMSPEQAGLSIADIDTRADVYGLGVLLFELLTGSTPFQKEQLASAAFDEACRIIREQEPPKPSTRLSSLGDSARSISQSRSTELAQLTRQIRGDLDWIVTKALDKNRNRRYESANSLANDINRYLKNAPIEARPPSLGYRLKKSVQRNQVQLTFICVLAVFLLGFMGLLTRSFLIENRLANKYRDQLYERVLSKVISGSPDSGTAIEEAQASGIAPEKLQILRGIENLFNGNPDATIDALGPIAENDPSSIPLNSMLANAFYQDGRLWEGIALRDHVSELQPSTDLDYLFLAYSALGVDNKGDWYAEKYLEKTKSPLGFLIQAEIAAHTFPFSDEPEKEISRALKSLQAAEPFLKDTAYFLQAQLEVYFHAYVTAEQLGIDSQGYKTNVIAAAKTMALKYPKYVWGRFWRGIVWSSLEEFGLAEDAWDVEKNDFLTANRGIVLIRRDKLSEAESLADEISDPLLRMFVFPALMQTETGKEKLNVAFKETLLKSDEEHIEYREPYVLAVGAFAGISKQELEKIAEKWLESWPDGKGDWSDWNRKCVNYYLNRDRKELYDDEEHGLYWEYSLFYIGLYELADGNVTEAREYFAKLNAGPASVYVADLWSRVLGEQLEKESLRTMLQR